MTDKNDDIVDLAGSAPAGHPEEDIDPETGLDRQLKEILTLTNRGTMPMPPANETQAPTAEHKFWSKQPVPQGDKEVEIGPLEPNKKPSEIRQTSYALPKGFTWCTLDITQKEQLDELYTLLNQNYVEDDDNMFRFDYSREFLLWALTPPGFKSVWHAGVRVDTSGKMVAFISAIPATLRIHKTAQELVEINFLCVHKRLRSKRLAPVLIKEITRRVHCEGLFQACYTAGVKIPTPIAESRYYHRNLNPKKLASIQFAHKPSKLTMNEWIKRYRLDKNTSTPGLRKMELKDAQAVHTLLSAHQERFEVTPLFTVEEVEHWLVPRDNVINSFVVENPTTHDITDFISFYSLPSTIVNNREYSILSAAYSYYNVATSVPLEDLMRDALILANNLDYDVFNALDLMENDSFLTPLKFGRGDGLLRYYLYNFGCPLMNPSRLGLVLL